jgi:hypothetical protein
MNPNVQVAREVVGVMTGGNGGENGGTPEKMRDAGIETETGNDGDVQTSEKGAANSTPGNEGSSVVSKKTMTAAATAEEGVVGSTRTKRLGACRCFLVARTQGAATRKGTAGEDH